VTDPQNFRPHIIIKDEPAAPVKREYTGGGASFPRADYNQHASKVTKEANELRALFSKSADSNTSKVYLKIELPADYKAEGSKGKIISDNLRAEIVGSPAENVAHISTNRKSFEDLTQELERYKTSNENVGKSKFSEVEGFSPIPFEEKVSQRFLDSFTDESDGDALVELFQDMSNEDANSVSAAIKKFVESKGGQVVDEGDVNSGRIIKVRSKRSVLEELSKMFVSVQGIDTVDQIISYEAIEGERLEDTLTVLPNTSKATACIIDTGVVQGSRFLDGSIIAQEYPFGTNKGVGVGHGTFVASRVIYGDDIKGQATTGTMVPDVKVLSICTKEFDALGNEQVVTIERLIRVIRDVVKRWHEQIKVYNLSIGCYPTKPGVLPGIKDDVVHPLAAEIDFLSRKYDVLFVISAGNYPHDGINPTTPYPKYFDDEVTRILSPSESMLAITVGSTAKEIATGCMATKDEPSPFTRRGPGFNGFRKPDLAIHGGNMGTGFRSVNHLMATGINSSGTSIAYGNGTSFSAPIITRLAAKIFEYYPLASASLVKALLLHFSDFKNSENFTPEVLANLIGNGIPVSEGLSFSTKHSQTFLYQGEMDFRDIIEVPFYVPKSLVNRKGNNVVNVKATITFYPETSKVLRKGYCKSHIRTKFIKIDSVGNEKDVGFSDAKEFDDGRYSTVIKMNKSFSNKVSPGDWKVLVAHESRWTLKDAKTRFAVVITVEDPKKEAAVDIYQSIRTEVPTRYKNEIKVRERIRT
jgi:subtilisin family serine protease